MIYQMIAQNMANKSKSYLEMIRLPKNTKEESIEIFSNKAIKGKPYLDIDRVIGEGVSAYNDETDKTSETKEV